MELQHEKFWTIKMLEHIFINKSIRRTLGRQSILTPQPSLKKKIEFQFKGFYFKKNQYESNSAWNVDMPDLGNLRYTRVAQIA
jgi:hypothetical protein